MAPKHDQSFDSQQVEVTLATPVGRGAIATLEVYGALACDKVSKFFYPAFGRPFKVSPVGRIVFGRWIDAQDAGEELVVCRRSSSLVEINCHGGRYAADRIMRTLGSQGCLERDWKDWLVDHESDLIAAEARIDLASARTARSAAILLDQYRGALRTTIERTISLLESHRNDEVESELRRLLKYSNLGLHLIHPWQVILAGRANVGKSSLINAILGYDRSIVFDQPGTTRDVVTAHTALDGWPIELSDTAGFRHSEDSIEEIGLEQARCKIERADLVVLVFEAHQCWSKEDQEIYDNYADALLVHNKTDLSSETQGRPTGILASAKTGHGITQIVDAITCRLIPDVPPSAAAVPFRKRQINEVKSALNAIESCELPSAISSLRSVLQHSLR